MQDMRQEIIEPKAWPEVEAPKGWKKNPRAGRLLTWILLLTVLVCGVLIVVSAPFSEVLPMVCFVALVLQAAQRLFQDNRIIAFVHLPQGLEEIPDAMFAGCNNLPAIVLPTSVTRIGSRAFAGCTELREVYVTAATTEIAPDAFEGCGLLLFHVQPGSAAEAWAKEHEFLTANR